MERQFKGIWIPAEIWLDENLTVMEKVLYAEIDSFCGNGKECFCSNAHFAKMLQVSERRVQQILTAMESKGVITRTVIYKEGTKEVERRYLKPTYFTTPHEIDFTTPHEEVFTTPHEENFVDTNTVFTNPLAAREQPPQETAKVVSLYENNIHPLTSLIERDKLLSLCDDYPFKWIESAIEEAALKNGRSLAYIIKILERWGRDGYKVDNRRSKSNEAPRELSFEEQVAQMEAARQKRMALEEEYLRRMEEAERNGKSAGNGEYTSGERTA